MFVQVNQLELCLSEGNWKKLAKKELSNMAAIRYLSNTYVKIVELLKPVKFYNGPAMCNYVVIIKLSK